LSGLTAAMAKRMNFGDIRSATVGRYKIPWSLMPEVSMLLPRFCSKFSYNFCRHRDVEMVSRAVLANLRRLYRVWCSGLVLDLIYELRLVQDEPN
jgi:hypothetical protein